MHSQITEKKFQGLWQEQPNTIPVQGQPDGRPEGNATQAIQKSQTKSTPESGTPANRAMDFRYTNETSQILWKEQQSVAPIEGQPDGRPEGDIAQGYQSPLEKSIHEFFCKYLEKQCPLREGYEGIKRIFERFDESNKKGYKFWKSNEHFDKDIAQAANATKEFFDLGNLQFLNNFHLLIYTTLRLEPEYGYLSGKMSQKEKDELIFSLPTLMNNILKDNERLLSVLECIRNIKSQFYDDCATDLLNLIKGHTEKVKAFKYLQS